MDITNSNQTENVQLLVNTAKLMKLLDCGKPTAIKIGTEAKAKFVMGRKILWNIGKIQRYLDNAAV